MKGIDGSVIVIGEWFEQSEAIKSTSDATLGLKEHLNPQVTIGRPWKPRHRDVDVVAHMSDTLKIHI